MDHHVDIAKCLAALGGLQKQGEQILLNAVDQFGAMVNGDAAQLAPVDTGYLKASHTETPAAIDQAGVVTKTIGFNTDYAAAVHENENARHDQGEAKYLQTAIDQMGPRFTPFLAARLKKGLKPTP